MNTPDEPQLLLSEPVAAAPPAVEAPVAETPAAETPETPAPAAPEAEAEAEVAAAEPAAASPQRTVIKRPAAKPRISDDTLAKWQATLAAEQALKDKALRAAQAARERSEAFRLLRDAVRHLESSAEASEPDAELTALRDDRLAMAVHQAPAHVREVLEATLKMLSGAPRRGRPARR